MNPEVLVLDEPMNGIDPKGKKFLKELLIMLNKSGKTIICATHDFEYVEGIFKRGIVFSENHNIVRDDRYENIIKDKQFLEEHNII
ncbi:Energy-coupling factor transporter ATP-binding protein EcfA2 [compost metagenome]